MTNTVSDQGPSHSYNSSEEVKETLKTIDGGDNERGEQTKLGVETDQKTPETSPKTVRSTLTEERCFP